MLLVVVAGDLILLLVGWEVMGICSYLLIGHDRTLPEAPGAAVKAFLVTRVGDVGFLLGIALLGVAAGSFRIADVLAPPTTARPATLTAACLLLLAGVAGKSAQFPLHTWLPDAMAGPTPISRADPRRDDGRRRRLRGGPAVPAVRRRAGGAGRARRDGRDHDAARRAAPRWPRTTSSGCWPGRRSASSAT